MKCAYKQCKFGNEVSKDIAVKHGTRYYHKECLEEANNKNEVRKLFLDNINQTEIVSGLNRTINNIVDIKNIPSDFLLFALKYVIRNKLPLNHAPGLFYIVNNDKIKEAYNKDKLNKMIKKIENNINDVSEKETEIKFNIDVEKNNGWNKILGR